MCVWDCVWMCVCVKRSRVTWDSRMLKETRGLPHRLSVPTAMLLSSRLLSAFSRPCGTFMYFHRIPSYSLIFFKLALLWSKTWMAAVWVEIFGFSSSYVRNFPQPCLCSRHFLPTTLRSFLFKKIKFALILLYQYTLLTVGVVCSLNFHFALKNEV